MKKHNLLILSIGVALIFIGMSISFIQGKNEAISIIPLVIGTIMTVLYIATNTKNLADFMTSKGFKYGANSLVMTVIFVAILVFLQIIVIDKKIQYDLTSDKNFTLSEQAQKVLTDLKNKLQVIAFVDKQNANRVKDLLEQFKTVSSNFSYEIIDPNSNPSKAKQYEIRENNTLVFVNGVKQEKINEITEEKITNTLIKVTREGQKKIYFVQGHGEKVTTDTNKDGISFIKDELNKQNYLTDNLIILQKKEIPNDASVIVLAGVEKDLMEEEETALKNYIAKGGRVLLLTDPDVSKGIRKFLTNYNIKVREDIIVDKLSKMYGGDFLMPMVAQYPEHQITKSLRAASFYPISSSLDISTSGKNNITVISLANTSPESWGEINKELLKQNQAKFDPEDTRGPLTIGALATIKVEDKNNKKADPENKKEKTGQLIVFGNSSFLANDNLNLSGNEDLALNAINWLAEENDLVSIKPKDRKNTPLVMDAEQGKWLLFSTLIFLPLLSMALGIFVITRRRFRTV